VEWLETTAKTVEDAKDRLLDQLGIDGGEAEFEVVEEPRKGLLGRIKGEARVRGRVRPTQPPPKADQRPRRSKGGNNRGRQQQQGGGRGKGGGRGDSGRSDRSGSGRSESGDRDSNEEVRRSSGSKNGRSNSGRRDSPRSGDSGQGGSQKGRSGGDDGGARRNTRDEGPRTRGRGREGGGRNGGAQRVAGTAAAAGAVATADGNGGGDSENSNNKPARKDTPTMNVDQQAEVASAFVKDLAEEFGASNLEVETVKIDDQLAEVRLTGDDVGLMIGPRGGTLQAIQELTKTVLQRACGGAGEGRVRIDIGGFRQRRREALEGFVLGLVDGVKDSGTPLALEPMNSADRKVVHDALTEVEGVETSSEGSDPNRRVVINPA